MANKNILFTAKYFDDKSHVSVICMDRDDIPADLKRIMDTEFMNLFNKVYDRNENSIDNLEEKK